MNQGAIQASNTAQYLVAKYIPNLRRMEPRNIGVVVLSPEGIGARFLGERLGDGDVDGRAIPAFVKSASAYKQWVAYWRGVIRDGSMEDRSGETVRFGQSSFLEALLRSGKGGYCLVNGGYLLDRITSEQVSDLTDRLYRELVLGEETEERPTLDSQLKRLFRETRLDRSPNLFYDYTVPAPRGINDKTNAPLTFSYAVKNGSLHRLYERVSLYAPQREQSVYSAAYKFERVIGTLVDKEQTGALVFAPQAQTDEKVQPYLDELRSITRVINLADTAAAKDEFAPLSALPEHKPRP